MSYHSHADLGGLPERRAVLQEAEADHFHAPWEERALALTLAMGATGLWNMDMSRATRETLPQYAELSYYQIWFRALERLVRTHGLLENPDRLPVAVLRAGEVAAVLGRGSPTRRPSAAAARFGIGEQVRTHNVEPAHHTRLPRYARGRRGLIERVHGTFVFPDCNAQGRGEAPQWLYGVSFEARELWGAEVPDPTARVSVDAFESYLAPDAGG